MGWMSRIDGDEQNRWVKGNFNFFRSILARVPQVACSLGPAGHHHHHNHCSPRVVLLVLSWFVRTGSNGLFPSLFWAARSSGGRYHTNTPIAITCVPLSPHAHHSVLPAVIWNVYRNI